MQRYPPGHQNGRYLCLSGTMTLSIASGKHSRDRDGGSLEQGPVLSPQENKKSHKPHLLPTLWASYWPAHSTRKPDIRNQHGTWQNLHQDLLRRGTWIRRGRSIPPITLSWKSPDLSVLWWRCRAGCLRPPVVMDFAAVLVAGTACGAAVEKAIETGYLNNVYFSNINQNLQTMLWMSTCTSKCQQIILSQICGTRLESCSSVFEKSCPSAQAWSRDRGHPGASWKTPEISVRHFSMYCHWNAAAAAEDGKFSLFFL